MTEKVEIFSKTNQNRLTKNLRVSLNHSITQSLNHSITQSLNHSITQSLNRKIIFKTSNYSPLARTTTPFAEGFMYLKSVKTEEVYERFF